MLRSDSIVVSLGGVGSSGGVLAFGLVARLSGRLSGVGVSISAFYRVSWTATFARRLVLPPLVDSLDIR